MRDKSKYDEYQRQYAQEHAEERNERSREWRRQNPEKLRVYAAKHYKSRRDQRNEASKQSKLRLRKDVLTHYGFGKLACVRCGFSDIRALTIDHLDGTGKAHRKAFGCTIQIYRHLRSNNYPDGYLTLCMNCQFIKRMQMEEHGDFGRCK